MLMLYGKIAFRTVPLTGKSTDTCYSWLLPPLDFDILDPVKPEALRPCFEALHHELQRGKVLEDFIVLGEYYLLCRTDRVA